MRYYYQVMAAKRLSGSRMHLENSSIPGVMERHVFAWFIDDRGPDQRLQLNEVSFLDLIYPIELFRM
jgi:hypothetical protein